MSISVEQPPQSIPAEASEYLNRVLVQVAGQFENLEREIELLKERIKVLEGP